MNGAEEKLRLLTNFVIPENQIIGLGSKLFLIGSCFSENIGLRLAETTFDTLVNPFGILYNPVSISSTLGRIIDKQEYSESELYFHAGKFHSLDHHGGFQSSTPSNLLETINTKLSEAHHFLKSCDTAVITLGTAYVYYHLQSQKPVGNCHKIPGTEFEKILLSEREIIDALRLMENRLRAFQPEIKICYTISPVKHLRDGIQENALSKARLLSSLQLFRQAGNHVSDYFPAYEIMTEELRDHRFYTEDLAHPSPWAIAYIFDRFLKTRFEPRAIEFVLKYAQYLRMEKHRPITTDNTELSVWAKKKDEFLDKIKTEFPEKQFAST